MNLYVAIEQSCEDYKLLAIAAINVAAIRSRLPIIELLTEASPAVDYSDEEVSLSGTFELIFCKCIFKCNCRLGKWQ